MTHHAPVLPAATLTDEQLLQAIDLFLDRSGMKPTRFGIEAMREGGLVESLRKGRSLSLKNANKVLAFIAEWDTANPDAGSGSAANSDENIGGSPDCKEADRRDPFPTAPEETARSSSGATSPISSPTSGHPLLPLDSPASSTPGAIRAA